MLSYIDTEYLLLEVSKDGLIDIKIKVVLRDIIQFQPGLFITLHASFAHLNYIKITFKLSIKFGKSL